MLKQAIKYKDWDGVERIDTLHFNLSKTELADNLDLQHEFEKIQRDFQGEFTRELQPTEIRRVLELVKRIMKMAYGTRSEDGKRFIKTDKQWEEFTQTAAYDAFLYGLFTNTNDAVAWLTAILPDDLRAAALEASNHVDGMSSERTAQVIEAQRKQADKAAEAQAAKTMVVDTTPLNEERKATGQPTLSDPPTEQELKDYMAWMNQSN